MTALQGAGIGQGIAVGQIALMSPPLPEPADTPRSGDAAAEKASFADAAQAVAAELNERGSSAGGQAQDVLEAQAMMAEDPTLEEQVHDLIDAGKTAERAVHEAFAAYAVSLKELGGYLGERAADLADVSARVIAQLRGVTPPGVPERAEPFVLVAPDLAPADTAVLDLTKVLAVVTTEGGRTSHTAILAADKGIVAVVGTGESDDLADGVTVIVDAAGDTVTIDPSDEQIADARKRQADREAALAAPITPGALADGTAVPLLANLGSPADAKHAVELGAEGVGLFRTEFLFLASEDEPSVTAQQSAYRELLQAFPGAKVVVRALDAGADKPLPFLTDEGEENPALGRRGLRALRHREGVLRRQLQALAAADAETDADLWVMAPMVATVEEAEYFTAIAKELGIKTAGVMIEVPSVALLAREVLEATDFGSIGTNDLVQYTMAADRMLGTVGEYQDPWHPAVLRLIDLIGKAGHETRKPIGICGQAAADPLLAVVLVGLGASTLSMSPPALADVRQTIGAHTLDDAKRIAQAALAAPDAASAKQAAQHAVANA